MDLLARLHQQLEVMGLAVDAAAEENLVLLLQEMLRWNKSHNLTAITDPLVGVEKHLVDSLTLLPLLDPDTALLDIGSGGGFPGLPLKLAHRSLSVVSVDAVAKKISFQRHIVRTMKLTQFLPWHGRAEDLPEQALTAERFDVVVARAFSSIPDLVRLALPCLRPDGRVVAMKGPEGEQELAEAADWLHKSGVRCLDVIRLTLPASGAARQLLILGR